jgi:hypothetical protein
MIKLTLRMTLTTSVKMMVLLLLAGEGRFAGFRPGDLRRRAVERGDIKGEIPIFGVHQFA